LCFLKIFQDDGRLENRDVADLKDGRFTERRNRQKPIRLVGKLDIDPLKGNALLGQRDHRSLHIGTELVADQF